MANTSRKNPTDPWAQKAKYYAVMNHMNTKLSSWNAPSKKQRREDEPSVGLPAEVQHVKPPKKLTQLTAEEKKLRLKKALDEQIADKERMKNAWKEIKREEDREFMKMIEMEMAREKERLEKRKSARNAIYGANFIEWERKLKAKQIAFRKKVLQLIDTREEIEDEEVEEETDGEKTKEANAVSVKVEKCKSAHVIERQKKLQDEINELRKLTKQPTYGQKRLFY